MSEIEIKSSEVYRYLGYRNIKKDPQIDELIESCKKEVLEVSSMKHFYRRFPLELLEDDVVKIEELCITSKSLSKNLRGCSEVIMFIATLGPEVDRVLARYSRVQVARALVFQAVAAAAIESYCNKCQREIERSLEEEKLFLRTRFSPGYGDVKLEVQKDFLSKIDSVKKVGVILNEGGLMIPEKSVSAFMGISSEKTECNIDGCEICGNENCAYRR